MGVLGGGEQVKDARPDYRLPIARSGEEQFAAIVRQRSGMDAGSIDAGIRDISHLSPPDQADAVAAAFSIYESYCWQSGLRAPRDVKDRHE